MRTPIGIQHPFNTLSRLMDLLIYLVCQIKFECESLPDLANPIMKHRSDNVLDNSDNNTSLTFIYITGIQKSKSNLDNRI